MALNPRRQTKPQYLRRLRSIYKDSRGIDSCKLASRMLEHIDRGDCTQGQMQSAWGMNAAQWTVKSVQLKAKADKWAAYKLAESTTADEAGD